MIADVDPNDLARRVQERLVAKTHELALELGYELVALGGRSNVLLTIHQLTVYAQTGTPPEHRQELVGEYLLAAAGLLDHLAPSSGIYEQLERVMLCSQARESIARRLPVPHAGLAALAGMSIKHLWQLASRGDAPSPEADPEDRRRRTYDPEASREWLISRGVAGLS